jgi:hypothetical protein
MVVRKFEWRSPPVLQTKLALCIVWYFQGDGFRSPWGDLYPDLIKQPLLSPFVDQEIVFMLAHRSRADLAVLAELMQSGKLVSVIERLA